MTWKLRYRRWQARVCTWLLAWERRRRTLRVAVRRSQVRLRYQRAAWAAQLESWASRWHHLGLRMFGSPYSDCTVCQKVTEFRVTERVRPMARTRWAHCTSCGQFARGELVQT